MHSMGQLTDLSSCYKLAYPMSGKPSLGCHFQGSLLGLAGGTFHHEGLMNALSLAADGLSTKSATSPTSRTSSQNDRLTLPSIVLCLLCCSIPIAEPIRPGQHVSSFFLYDGDTCPAHQLRAFLGRKSKSSQSTLEASI